MQASEILQQTSSRKQRRLCICTTCTFVLLISSLLITAISLTISYQSFAKQVEIESTKMAVCQLRQVNKSNVAGTIEFLFDGETKITGKITGLPINNTIFGLHIYQYCDENVDLSNDPGPFDPYNLYVHSCPPRENRKIGDLGNFKADESGIAIFDQRNKKVKLSGIYSVVGRVIYVKSKQDDCITQPSGNSGVVLAQCCIGRKWQIDQ
eukprot:TRINITY_DN1529_c0_g2_i1.p1 TRINITY_DN1529_c0_g2~~TRINITY_DN1529_c0_g2_i1.p1  ORF type:complete len:209 (+),score=88.93 TRINITY_DN1529_c0_g2_i1:143-769(+)